MAKEGLSDQAEGSKQNPIATSTQMRILIELQVISSMLQEAYGMTEDLKLMREDIAQSMFPS